MKTKEQLKEEFGLAAMIIDQLMQQFPSDITRKVAVMLNAFYEEELASEYEAIKQEFASTRKKAN